MSTGFLIAALVWAAVLLVWRERILTRLATRNRELADLVAAQQKHIETLQSLITVVTQQALL